MSTARRILLIDPLGDADAAQPLEQALLRAGAQVRRIALPGQAEAVLDAIEQGWVPVALKPVAAAAHAAAHPPAADAATTGQVPSPPGGAGGG